MADISSPRPLPPIAPTPRASVPPADLALKLLQPLQGLLATGQSASAEVMTVKEAGQSFQLMLRLTLDNGRQATLQATSTRPLAQGAAVVVTALAETRLAVMLQAGGNPALTQLDLDQLPQGSLLQAKVLTSETLSNKAPHTLYKVLVSLLNTPLAGSKLTLETPLSLSPGSLLTAQVQGSQALNFLPLGSRLDQLELGQQLGNQLNRQGSLDGLFKALQGLNAQSGLPEGLRTSLDKLFGALPDGAQLSTPKGLAQAMENSGLFLEAKLLGGQTNALPQDLKANLLRLIAHLLPGTASSPGQLVPSGLPGAGLAGTALAQGLPAFARQALGSLGQSGSRQQALSFPLPSRLLQAMDGEADLETLLKLAAAAVSRLQTHQLSSMAQTQVGPDGNLLTTWQLELPMRNQQEWVPLQIKLQREDPAPKQGKKEQAETLWRVELAFDLAPLGPLQVQAQLLRGSLSSQLWAERASTASLIETEMGHLRERLIAAGLQVGELDCRQGTPPQGPRTQLEQRWVDETA
ncbi:MAG: flagellar hook-length control protein FliK [Pseudomonadota bacterium]